MITDKMVLAATAEAVRRGIDISDDARSILEAADATAWKPIKTAPKDGTQILAYAADPRLFGRAYYGVAEWADADPDFPRAVPGWFWSYAIRPTHWRPLPAPPIDGEKR